MKLNEKILYYRKAAKLSQEELAARVGVSRQAVSKWELGDATPEVDKLLALARTFGVTTDELLSADDPVGGSERSETPVYTVPGASGGDGLDRAAGRVGGLIRRFGWLAGVYIALSGLGVAIVGALARWGFGAMLARSAPFLGDFNAFSNFMYNGSGHAASEWDLAQWELLNNSPALGMQRFALGFATVIIVAGVVMMIAGVVLAVVLYRKGNKKP